MSRRNTPPGPSPFSAYSNVRAFIANRPEFMQSLWEEYGDFLRFRLGFFDVYMISDPERIKQVLMDSKRFHRSGAVKFLKFILGNGLLVNEGESHRRQRRLMQPAFQPANIAAYADKMVALAGETSEAWQRTDEIEIRHEMTGVTLRIAARTLFNTEAASMTKTVEDAMETVLPFVNRIAQPTGALQMLLPSPSNFRFRKARKALDDIIYGMIHEHRNSGVDHGDLLSRLIAAQDAEGDGAGMTDEQIRDEAITMFIAGHETTALTLTWMWYLLARHPQVEAKLHEELDRVLGGRTPTMEDVADLKYTRMVISETLRLYPPAYLLDRVTAEDWDCGEFIVPKGKYIFMSPYIVHRHPAYWEDPERFDPERWTPEAMAKRPKFSYFPFGGGLRICIGEHFAWLEMLLVVATLAQRHRLSLVSDQAVSIAPLVTLRPKGDILMRIHSRVPTAEAQPIA